MKCNERLREIRKNRKFTQKQVGVILGKTPQGYNHLEAGRAELKIEDLKMLCKFYGVSADYLLGLTDEIKPLE